MAISLSSIKRGVSSSAPIIIVYGDGGIGKTSFAAGAPDPIFIFTENSLGKLTIDRFSFNTEEEEERVVANSYEEVMERLYFLLTEEHPYKSVVIDTLDWMEPLVWSYLMRQTPTTEKGKAVSNINDYGYGLGYKMAIDCWREFLDMLGALRSKRDMMVILVAHHTKEKIMPPDGVSYDAYTLKLQNSDKVSAKDKVVEYSDIVLFANWRTGTTEEKMSSGKTRNRAVGSGERIVYTEQRPAHEAKNRYCLPAQIRIPEQDLQWKSVWDELALNIPWFQQFTAASTTQTEGE